MQNNHTSSSHSLLFPYEAARQDHQLQVRDCDQVRASEEGNPSHPKHAHKQAYVHTQPGTEGEGRHRPKQITKLHVTWQGPGKP